jgi:hypothetical protein
VRRRLSASFHGRDLFNQSLQACSRPSASSRLAREARDVHLDAHDFAAIIYVDHYGNLTGLRAGRLPRRDPARGRRALRFAHVSEADGGLFWRKQPGSRRNRREPRSAAPARLSRLSVDCHTLTATSTIGHGAQPRELAGCSAGRNRMPRRRACGPALAPPSHWLPRIRLQAAGIGYGAAGARRIAAGRRLGSPPGTREATFRAYAAHGIDSSPRAGLIDLALDRRICLMCAERDPRQCHRSLIADWLAVHGHRIVHLIAAGESVEHLVNAAARIEGGRLHYVLGGPQGSLF